jgi:lambda family phage portal protein
MVEDFATDVVGDEGPTLQIVSPDEDWNKEVEQGFAAWSAVADVGGRMHFSDLMKLEVRQLFESGEGLTQHVMTDDRSLPVRRRLLTIEPDRLSSPYGTESSNVRKGVEVDPKTGKPIAYWILKDHPGSMNYTGQTGEYDRIEARDIIHLYKVLRPGQTRGVPWLAPVLDLFGQLRDLTHHTLLAAEYAAALAVFIWTNHEQAEFDDCEGDLDVLDIEPGTASMLPQGWQATQIKPEQPSENYVDFKRELLKEVGRPVSMPYLIIGKDASEHNYSSARMDLQGYWKSVKYAQGMIGRHYASPNVRLWIQEAVLAKAIGAPPPPGDWKITWTWNQPTHVDPAKEEAAAVLRMANGTTTFAEEAKRKGHNWEDVFKQRAKEQKRAEELGLTLDYSLLVLKAASIIGKENSEEGTDE